MGPPLKAAENDPKTGRIERMTPEASMGPPLKAAENGRRVGCRCRRLPLASMGPPLKAAENLIEHAALEWPDIASMGPPLKAAENRPDRGPQPLESKPLQWGRR